MITFPSHDARQNWRRIQDAILRGEHVLITRHGSSSAVMVPHDWYEKAQAILATEPPEGTQP